MFDYFLLAWGSGNALLVLVVGLTSSRRLRRRPRDAITALRAGLDDRPAVAGGAKRRSARCVLDE